MRLIPLAFLLTGCASTSAVETQAAPAATTWRAQATAHDRERLRGWRSAWVRALREAQAGGHGDAVAREGALLDPDAALPGPALPDGTYACRVLKLGTGSGRPTAYSLHSSFQCRVRDGNNVASFSKLTGSQRAVGHLFPDSDRRQVFLGTMVLGDETMAQPYGRDRARDVAGWVERVGPQTWRMVFPSPAYESTLDVVELTPEG